MEDNVLVVGSVEGSLFVSMGKYVTFVRSVEGRGFVSMGNDVIIVRNAEGMEREWEWKWAGEWKGNGNEQSIKDSRVPKRCLDVYRV